MSKLPIGFYQQEDVLMVSRDLLGKVLYSNIEDRITSGIIVETEAYAGITDKASHAYGGRKTHRTRVMYEPGGKAYVYLCYGIHHLFNIVTNKSNVPDAVLIRAIEPQDGLKVMLERRNKKGINHTLTAGPGSLTQALGITIKNSGAFLMDDLIWLEDQNINYTNQDILASPRVGVQYAGKDISNPWRFQVENSPWVSPAS